MCVYILVLCPVYKLNDPTLLLSRIILAIVTLRYSLNNNSNYCKAKSLTLATRISRDP